MEDGGDDDDWMGSQDSDWNEPSTMIWSSIRKEFVNDFTWSDSDSESPLLQTILRSHANSIADTVFPTPPVSMLPSAPEPPTTLTSRPRRTRKRPSGREDTDTTDDRQRKRKRSRNVKRDRSVVKDMIFNHTGNKHFFIMRVV